jgi:hypothetical protein
VECAFLLQGMKACIDEAAGRLLKALQIVDSSFDMLRMRPSVIKDLR